MFLLPCRMLSRRSGDSWARAQATERDEKCVCVCERVYVCMCMCECVCERERDANDENCEMEIQIKPFLNFNVWRPWLWKKITFGTLYVRYEIQSFVLTRFIFCILWALLLIQIEKKLIDHSKFKNFFS